jgi:D-alanyl-D-alanine carboxypeptidase (penicillin-binding protein 5/6)
MLVWSNAPITVTTQTTPMRVGSAGERIGTVTFTQGKTVVKKPLTLAKTIEDPGVWWRFMHPLTLFG